MKTLLVSLFLLLPCAASVSATTAELTIFPKEFGPLSTVTLTFSASMIEKAQVGSRAEESPLIISPKLAGHFEWTSTRTGTFVLEEAPKFDASYYFSLRSGLKDLTGAALASTKLKDYMTEKFHLVGQSPQWFSRENLPRDQALLFQFNDTLKLDTVGPAFTFHCLSTKQKIPATARFASGKDFRSFGADVVPTWAEQIAKVEPTVEGDALRESAVVVSPSVPLEAGAEWTLDVATTLLNAIESSKLCDTDSIRLGVVQPFMVRSIRAQNSFDRKPHVTIAFNKPLGQAKEKREVTLATVIEHVLIDPPVPDVKPTFDSDNAVELHGSFALDTTYQISILPGIVARDGLALTALVEDTVVFTADAPYLALAGFIHAQMATGKGEFSFVAANVTQARVRAKLLTGAELVSAVEKYEPYEQNRWSRGRPDQQKKPTPLDQYPGKVIYDRTFPVNKPLQQSELIKVLWKEVLGEHVAAPLMIEIEGAAMPGADGTASIAQSLVEFTDIGLFQKDDQRSSTVMAVSLSKGTPIEGAVITLFDKDSKSIGTAKTNAEGLATIDGDGVHYVLAEVGSDCTALPAQDYDTLVPLWHYNVNQAWENPWKESRRTFLYADRNLFKPGETAHFKAYTRLSMADDLKLDAQPPKATLRIYDSRGKLAIEKAATFTANGSWNEDLIMPVSPTGWYEAKLDFEGQSDDGRDALHFRVDDYRPNTFEVKVDVAAVDLQPDRMKLPVRAAYYMGKPLTKAKVTWQAFLQAGADVPESYNSYHFGDAPSWSYYGKDRDAEVDSDSDNNEWSTTGEVELNEEGIAMLDMAKPTLADSPMPRRIHVSAEITDINEQTLSANGEFQLPGPTFMLGMRSSTYWATANKPMSVDVVAIKANGDAHQADVPVKVKLEHQSYQTLKVQAAGGAETTKNQVLLKEEFTTTATLKAATPGVPASLTLPITPKLGGSYFLTIEAEAAGSKVFTRMPIWVIGGEGYPWAMQEGAHIDLQVDKRTLNPGEKAKVVVKTPIAGRALVTIERNKIHRSFQQAISPEQPVIEIPVTAEDAPNIYVSVLVIRGANDSPQSTKMPEYRMGLTELKVTDTTHELSVKVAAEAATVRPSSPAAITATITDSAGKPVPNAEVTLMAVDEGVLSLMSYKTPQPQLFFNEPKPLAISTRTNFDRVVSEDAQVRERGNKGFVVGDGGFEGDLSSLPSRKNFQTTPLWVATVTSAADGTVKASFTTPDNLSRFRLMAVASEGVRRFGSGEAAITINKPLMVEPALPRFARVQDEVLVKSIVHNTTANAGEVEVKLTLDDRAAFITEERDFVLASLNPDDSKPDGNAWTKKVPIKANDTIAVAFPVKFTRTGDAKWSWSAKTALANDATESTFKVGHPMQERHETQFVKLSGAKLPENLAKGISPALLEGDGQFTVSVSNSRLVEITDALDYVLHYPYGCVEQTTSSLMPWIVLSGFNDIFGDRLTKARANDAIQAGANRLLAMVTDAGGLAYWPGGKDPTLFASAYGGMGLMKAKSMGAAVPEKTLHELLEWMSQQLRHVDDERDTTTMVDDALALYALARGGRSEPAYENMLFLRRAKLPNVGKLYLALAMCVSKSPEKQIRTLLAESNGNSAWEYWIGEKVNNALRLLVLAHLGDTEASAALAQSLLETRGANGEWGNTFTNAWVLTALAGYERSLKTTTEPVSVEFASGDTKHTLELPKPGMSQSWSAPLTKAFADTPLKVTMPKDRSVWARIDARAYPQAVESAGENKGYGITRTYEKIGEDGTTENVSSLRVGDLVLVTLTVDLSSGGDRYVAIDDPLPAVLEALNPDFDTQKVRRAARPQGVESWFCDHRELRADRALFFTDYCPGKGKFEITYLARAIAEGDVIAPSTRIEAMYSPGKHGLGATQRIRSLPPGVALPVAVK